MITRLEMYYNMSIARLLADWGVIFNDEVVREAGEQGARAGEVLKNSMVLEECKW